MAEDFSDFGFVAEEQEHTYQEDEEPQEEITVEEQPTEGTASQPSVNNITKITEENNLLEWIHIDDAILLNDQFVEERAYESMLLFGTTHSDLCGNNDSTTKDTNLQQLPMGPNSFTTFMQKQEFITKRILRAYAQLSRKQKADVKVCYCS
jgi:hypothetical protein